MGMWQIIFYPPKGERHSPYDFLKEMPDGSAQAQIVHRLRVISELPLSDWPSWTHRVEGKIYQLSSGAYRVMYFLDGEDIVIVHAFRKKSRKTRRSAINRALDHRTRYFDE